MAGQQLMRAHAAGLSLAFCITIAVLTFRFWQEAWDNKWVSDTMWRARLWIPYSSMPIGLGLLTLQAIADLVNLANGRERPFGMAAEHSAAAELATKVASEEVHL